MEENIRNFLDWQHWDLCKIVKKIRITQFIDPLGGRWDTVAPMGPCGCSPIKTGDNAYRTFLWCPKHPKVGVLCYGYRENTWFWISPDLIGEGVEKP